jgi:cysteine desulfurase
MGDRRIVNLDHAATTPLDARVIAAMQEAMQDEFSGNPASSHGLGRAARELIERAAASIAQRINAPADSLVFTSGATESNHLALLGATEGRSGQIITTRIEHASVLEPCAALARRGFELTYLDCDAEGRIDPAHLSDALTDRTVLVSIMHVNNETGVIQDIDALAQCCRKRRIPMHVDAAQSIGRLLVDVERWGVDMVSLSAHKAHGPKGIGALYLRPGLRVAAQFLGGEQQRGLRAGTLPTHQIVGMGRAFELADPARDAVILGRLSGQLRQALAAIPDARFNGRPECCAPHLVNVSFPGIDGESLRLALEDLAVSAGSACHSDAAEPSRVLSAMGLSDARAAASLRLSVGRGSSAEDIAYAAQRIATEVARLRELARGAPRWCSA